MNLVYTENSRVIADKDHRVEYDDDKIQTLENHEHIKTVEPDGEMKTQ